MNQSYQKTARGTFLYFVTRVLGFIAGLIQLPLLTKGLGTSGYGLWSQSQATVNLVLPTTHLGLSFAMTRFLAPEKDPRAIREGFYTVFFSVLLTNVIASIVILGIAPLLARVFFDGETVIVRLTAVLVLVTPLRALHMNLFQTMQQFVRFNVIEACELVVQLGVIVFLVLSGYGLEAIIIGVIVLRLALLAYLAFSVGRRIGFAWPRTRVLLEYMRYGLPLVPRSMSFWLISLSDRYMIAYFLGTSSVGVYSAGYAIGELPYTFSAVMAFALLPTVFKLYDEGKYEVARTHLSYTFKYFMAVAIPFLVGAFILAEPVLLLFTTPEFAAEGHLIVPVVALGTVFLGVHVITVSVPMLLKNTRLLAVVWTTAALLNVGLNLVMIPAHGIMGAAWTTLIAYTAASVIVTIYASRKFAFNIHPGFLAKSVISAGVMGAVVWFISPASTLTTALSVVAGTAIYAILLLVMKSFSPAEFALLKNLVKRGNPEVTGTGDYER